LQALKATAPQVLQEKLRAAKDEIDGERKPVTILFADIVGSTALAEKLDPEEWKEIVSGAHQNFLVMVSWLSLAPQSPMRTIPFELCSQQWIFKSKSMSMDTLSGE
jgi:hypothetical protein